MQCPVSDFMLFDLSAVFDTVNLFFGIGILSVLALGHPSHSLMSLATSVSFSKFLECPARNISSLSVLFQSWGFKNIYILTIPTFFLIPTFLSPFLTSLLYQIYVSNFLLDIFIWICNWHVKLYMSKTKLICTPPTNLFP